MRGRVLLSALLVILPINAACSRRTDNPQDDVVKLRDGIVALVEGRTSELTGSIAAGETYVLLSGYMTNPPDISSLSVTPGLREELAGISPHTEKYAIARIRGDSVEEYTYFEQGWPRDPADRRMP